MSGALSRNKGKGGERELGHILTNHGISFIREQDGRTQGADFAFGPYRLECRRRNQLQIVKWSEEIEEKCAEADDFLIPVLAYRPDRTEWRVSMLAGDWASLVNKAGWR